MKTLLLVLVCVAGLTGVAAAQSALNEGQGHPLKGIWIGDWGPDKAKRTPVLIEMNWDGKAITRQHQSRRRQDCVHESRRRLHQLDACTSRRSPAEPST